MKLKEIAQRINAYLKLFETNPKINQLHKESGWSYRDYYYAGCIAGKRFIYVTYIAYQGHIHLSKEQALEYLAWLDAGNVGYHYDMERSKNVNSN